MNTRAKFSVVLLCLGLILALIASFQETAHLLSDLRNLLSELLDNNTYYSVDQVARFIVSEDSTVQIIDLRTPEEFRTVNIPGSINIPYKKLLDRNPGSIPQ